MLKKGLILIPFLTGYGGTETVIKNFLGEYNKKINKHNVNRISIKLYSLGGYIKGDWLHFPNVKKFQFPKNRYIREFLYIFLLPLLILYIIVSNSPDFVIATNPIIWTISKLISELFNKHVKIIAWYHYSYKLKPVSNYCLSKPDYFFTISKAGKKELKNLGISSNIIHIVYNPIEPTNKTIRPSKYHNQLVYVGRLEYKKQKNISELFKALKLLRNKIWTLRIYGIGPDKERLVKLSYELHISNRIKWMGFIPNPFDHIKYADALILTSKYEGFPMALSEAISHGLYVISSNCPSGPSELIKGCNGRLYECGNIKQLSSLINNVLSSNICLNQNEIKESISKYYINNYYRGFVQAIKIILR